MDGKLYRETPLGEWFKGKGGQVNDALVFRRETTGHRLEATDAIESGVELVSMPYELAITPKLVLATLPTRLTQGSELGEHQLMCLYLMLHDLALAGVELPESMNNNLTHLEYVKTLPRPEQMQTALWFSDSEFELLNGSNLYPAVLDRRQDWKAKYKHLISKLDGKCDFDLSLLTWHRFLWASTALSSRAFPSYLLDGDKANPTQILLPCIDVFNHKRGTAVTWFSDHKNKRMQLITDERIESGNEVFNNYGAKPNDELLLGYGFVLADNPSDIISLRFGAAGDETPLSLLEELKIPISRSHYIRKDTSNLPAELKSQVRILVAEEDELSTVKSRLEKVTAQKDSLPADNGTKDKTQEPWESAAGFLSWPNELEMLEQLADMFVAKLNSVQGALSRTQEAKSSTDREEKSPARKRRRSASPGTEGNGNGNAEGGPEGPSGISENGVPSHLIREDIRDMIELYLLGQIGILQQCIALQEAEFEKTVQEARADGFDVEMEEGDAGESDGAEDVEDVEEA